jgi:hypothetical protein
VNYGHIQVMNACWGNFCFIYRLYELDGIQSTFVLCLIIVNLVNRRKGKVSTVMLLLIEKNIEEEN